MKITSKILIIILTGLLCPLFSNAQNVGINATGAVPNASAMLDVSSTIKGMLIPRMTHAQMNAIAAPATGLLVYDTDAPAGFYYYDGVAWLPILSTAVSANGGWRLIGNAGTVDGTNFLGTTDSVAFSIRVNNQKAGRIDPGLKNTFYGYKAGFANSTGNNNFFEGQYAGVANTSGSHNIAIGNNAMKYNVAINDVFAIGDSALYAPMTSGDLFAIGNRAGKNNTSGFRNFYLGNDAGYNTTSGFYNMFVGAAAGYNNTTGTYNYVFGRATLYLNKTSNFNIAFGREAGYTHQAGDNNIFIGQFAGQLDSSGVENTIVGNYSTDNNYTGKFLTCLGFSTGTNNTTGNYNTFLGHMSGYLNTTGSNNTFVGERSGYNSTGGNNTSVGYQAGQTTTTGSSNTFLGYQADGSATLTNATAIGANSLVTLSNSMVLGGTGVNAVSVGIGVTAPAATLEVNGYTMLGTNAPAVKMVKLTSTSAATQGGLISIPHGLVLGKILAVDVLLDYGGGVMPPSFKGVAGYEYNIYVTATDVVVWNQAANSANILSRPVRVLITYEQ